MSDGDDPPVTADEIRTMADEISRGISRHDSAVTMTAAHRRVWDDLADQAERLHHRRWRRPTD